MTTRISPTATACEQQLLKANERLHTIIELQWDFAAMSPPRDVIVRRICENARDLVGADFTAFAVPDGDEIEFPQLFGSGEVKALRIHRDASLTGWCLKHLQSVRCGNVRDDVRASITATRDLQCESLLLAPVLDKGNPIGVLAALSGRQDAFSEESLSMLELLAGILGSGLSGARAQEDRLLLLSERTAAQARSTRSEELLRALAEHSDEVMQIADTSGNIKFVTHSVTRLMGWTPEEILGTSYTAWVHPEDVESMTQAITSVLQEPGRTESVTVRLRHKDGRWLYMDFRGRNLTHIPVIGGIAACARDVTERVALESQVRQAQKIEAVGQLAGGMAHDFNNVLTAISGYSELLIADETSAEKRADLLEIKKAAHHGAELTKKLLAFSRKQDMNIEVLDVAAVARGLERMLKRVLDGGVLLHGSYSDSETLAEADVTQLEQVIINLVLNARDALPNGGVIQVEVAAEDQFCVLRVTDNGVGMSPEVRARIFEPFFTTKPKGKGSGLGLAVVYGIVQQLRGTIQVESAPLKGTSITIRLPRVHAASLPQLAVVA